MRKGEERERDKGRDNWVIRGELKPHNKRERERERERERMRQK